MRRTPPLFALLTLAFLPPASRAAERPAPACTTLGYPAPPRVLPVNYPGETPPQGRGGDRQIK
ncbi:hypothetical protein GMSM_04850 [Geomonas sp. Red276]